VIGRGRIGRTFCTRPPSPPDYFRACRINPALTTSFPGLPFFCPCPGICRPGSPSLIQRSLPLLDISSKRALQGCKKGSKRWFAFAASIDCKYIRYWWSGRYRSIDQWSGRCCDTCWNKTYPKTCRDQAWYGLRINHLLGNLRSCTPMGQK
jgi:hypothetical protein